MLEPFKTATETENVVVQHDTPTKNTPSKTIETIGKPSDIQEGSPASKPIDPNTPLSVFQKDFNNLPYLAKILDMSDIYSKNIDGYKDAVNEVDDYIKKDGAGTLKEYKDKWNSLFDMVRFKKSDPIQAIKEVIKYIKLTNKINGYKHNYE